MHAREWLIRAGRAAGIAAVVGVAVASFFYAMRGLGADARPPGIDTRRFHLEALPKPEEFGWLVGGLAFVALLLVPLPRQGPRWAWGLTRAAAGALALTLPLDAWDNSWNDNAAWFPWVAAGLPAFVALLLTAVPLEGRRKGPAAPAPVEKKEEPPEPAA